MRILTAATRMAHKLPPTRTKVRIGRVASFVLAKIGVTAVVPVRLLDGTLMLLDARGRTEGEAVWNGRFDPDLLTILRTCLPPGGRLLDVGANVGLIAIPLARTLQSEGGSVLAVEPVAVNRGRLKASARLNDVDVRVFGVALGDQEGEIEIHRDAGLNASSGNAIIGAAGAGYGPSDRVPLTTLDALDSTESLSPIDVVKVDIEGAEVPFLRGADAFLRKNRPVILGEFNSGLMPRFGNTFLDVADLMKPFDYRFVKFDASGAPVEITPAVGMGNAALIPEERFAEVFTALMGRRR